MSDYYIYDDNGKPVGQVDLFKWVQWLSPEKRKVVHDTLKSGVKVSTVFLGLDHSFGRGVPLLWETMIFGGEHDQYQERYTSLEDAKKGHAEALIIARSENV